MYVCMYVCTYVRMYVCTYVSMYLCMYDYVCMYTTGRYIHSHHAVIPNPLRWSVPPNLCSKALATRSTDSSPQMSRHLMSEHIRKNAGHIYIYMYINVKIYNIHIQLHMCIYIWLYMSLLHVPFMYFLLLLIWYCCHRVFIYIGTNVCRHYEIIELWNESWKWHAIDIRIHEKRLTWKWPCHGTWFLSNPMALLGSFCRPQNTQLVARTFGRDKSKVFFAQNNKGNGCKRKFWIVFIDDLTKRAGNEQTFKTPWLEIQVPQRYHGPASAAQDYCGKADQKHFYPGLSRHGIYWMQLHAITTMIPPNTNIIKQQ